MALFKYQGTVLDKIIYKKTIPIQTEFIRPQYPKSNITQLDNDTLVVDLSRINYIELIIWGGIFLFLFIGPLLPNFEEEPDKVFSKIVYISGEIFLFYLILNCFLESKKKFVFNRKEGTITYPLLWFFSETVPFDESLPIRGKQGPRSAIPMALGFVSKNRRSRSFIQYVYPYASLSFYVWYMDKNRPLPTGTAFDPYREADYLRRRSEGFPAPLYPSAIETPEWEGAITKYGDKEAKERGFARYEPRWSKIALVIEEELPDRLLNDEQELINRKNAVQDPKGLNRINQPGMKPLEEIKK